jgi:CheY-like chemotaxis protein
LALRDIDLHDCIHAALDSVRGQAEAKSQAIRTDFDRSIGAVNADPGRLEQVFRNLLTNAVKFTPRGGTITVRSKLKSDEGQVEVQVEDTGKGIHSEFLPFLFTRFTQEDSSATRTHVGLGLGLAIARELVEKHQGTIRAYSPGEGKGSVFTVTLPCTRSHQPPVTGTSSSKLPEPTIEAGAQPADLNGLRVLVIDDLDDAREAFAAMLQMCRARVETASSAAAGLTALAQFKPDVILCDVAMPKTDGLSFIRSVRQLSSGKGGKTPAIAVTAYAGFENERKALDAGFDAHVAKPADAAEVSRLIVNLTKRRKKKPR